MKTPTRTIINRCIEKGMKRIFLLVLVLMIGCKSQKNTEEKLASASTYEQEALKLLLSDNYGGTEYPEIQIIKDQKALKKFFIEINKTRKPGLPVPEIDFTKEMVVVYCSGKTQNPTGSSLVLKKESDTEKVLGIQKVENQEYIATSAIIFPFSVYKIPLTDKRIVLEPIQ